MYELIRSDRKTIAIQIKDGGRVVVRAPRRTPVAEIQKFVDAKKAWIETHVRVMRQRQAAEAFSQEELRRLADAAVKDLAPRAARFAAAMGVSYNRITIRAQKSRWGSCSAKGNLNFNCLLMLCPEDVRDYVVVHELCHLKELNHSARFWKEVAAVLPDYAPRRSWLKENGGRLIQRLKAMK